jgi:hypothetical protein
VGHQGEGKVEGAARGISRRAQGCSRRSLAAGLGGGHGGDLGRACREEEEGTREERKERGRERDGSGRGSYPHRAERRWRSSLHRIDDRGQDTELLLCLEEDDEEIGVGWALVGCYLLHRVADK